MTANLESRIGQGRLMQSVFYCVRRGQTIISRRTSIRSNCWRQCGSTSQSDIAAAKLYLKVPYLQRNFAKSKGARWDNEAKLWYVPENLAHKADLFERWKPQEHSEPIVESVAQDEPIYDLPVKCEVVEEEDTVEEMSESEANELVVIYDIETSGLYTSTKYRTVPLYNQLKYFNTCRIVQMSYVVCKRGSFDIVDQGDMIIKADGFNIANEQFHGVTMERSEQEGIPFEDAAKKFLTACNGASYLIAHNAMFDVLVTRSELFRYNLTDCLTEFDALKVVCSMKKTKAVVKCKGKDNRIKNPKLKELYEFAIDKKIENEHNAMFDVLNLHAALRTLRMKNRLNNLFAD